MQRRRFLEALGGTAIGLGLLQRETLALPSADAWSGRRNWTWVHGRRELTADAWRERFARIRAAGIHGVLVSGGDTELLSGAAHAEDLEFHRWIWTLNRSGDHWVKQHHPEWFTVRRNGVSSLERPPYVGYYQWLCPTRPGVREYLRGVVDSVAGEPGVDGVHLDYIRHADVILPIGLWSRYDLVQDREYPEFDFCYCDVCRETFERQTGRDPVGLSDPPQDIAWREFRWQGLTDLVRLLVDTVHVRGKRISAAVFPTPGLARKLVRQAWEQWPLDAVFPMIYHDFYQEDLPWIGAATAEGVAALPARVPLYGGLYLPSLSPEDLAAAVRLAYRAGARGVSLFELGRFSDEHLARFREALEE